MSLSSVAVVGAGPRGLSVAAAIAETDLAVTVVCATRGSQEAARRRLERLVEMRIDIGELSRGAAEEIVRLVSVERDLSAATGTDLVIESTVGDVRARRAFLATVEGRMSRGSVLASNIARQWLPMMAEVLIRPDQFLGLRFFHPATHSPRVEVMPLPETAPGAVFACQTLCRWMGKTPVEQVEGEAQDPSSAVPKRVGVG